MFTKLKNRVFYKTMRNVPEDLVLEIKELDAKINKGKESYKRTNNPDDLSFTQSVFNVYTKLNQEYIDYLISPLK